MTADAPRRRRLGATASPEPGIDPFAALRDRAPERIHTTWTDRSSLKPRSVEWIAHCGPVNEDVKDGGAKGRIGTIEAHAAFSAEGHTGGTTWAGAPRPWARIALRPRTIALFPIATARQARARAVQ